ncbi:MAG: response regulator, partial [Rhodothermales bacterium]
GSMLTERGYKVRAVPNGEMALQAARSAPPDLILLDIRMPGLSGYEVCTMLKEEEETQKIPIIFISAIDETQDKVKAFTVGGVDYITKPFHVEEVLVRVENQLALHTLQRQLREANETLARQKAKIEAQAQRLIELDEMKSNFFANISHEFRTPLTLILGTLQDIQKGLHGSLEPSGGEQLTMAQRHARQLRRLIEQILDLARIEAGMMRLAFRPVDLVALFQDVMLSFAALAEREQIHFTLDAPETPVVLYLDPDALTKVFTNLLSNAFKFTPSGGTIHCSVHAPSVMNGDETVQISVRDTGVGLPPETLPHLFERFYQAHPQNARLQTGTGLGLALTRELILLHHGHIGVSSEEGHGSTFTVTLPSGRAHLTEDDIVEHEERPDHARAPMMEEIAHERDAFLQVAAPGHEETTTRPGPGDDDEDVTTVLVVDDNAEIREYIRRHLESDFRVVEAANGAEGLQQARSILPDLIISDVVMPEMDGYALCRALKQDPSLDYIPIILLTVKATAANKLEGWEKGIDDYLTKPFSVEELRARVQNLIASRQRLRQRFAQQHVVVTASEIPVTSADDLFLQRIRSVVETHLSDTNFNVESLAAHLAMDRSSLYRRLRALVQQSPTDIIRSIRLERAAQLLSGRAGSISEIAYGVGFKSVAHFSTRFGKKFGVPPSKYAASLESSDPLVKK